MQKTFFVGEDVLVLKTNEPERLRRFFEAIGLEFVREQHGAGPVHFACGGHGKVFEIYPEEGPTIPNPREPEIMRKTISSVPEVEICDQCGRSASCCGVDVDGENTTIYSCCHEHCTHTVCGPLGDRDAR
jgi:hypothetical protein